MTPNTAPPVPPAPSRDLTDAEFAELDDLLAAAPAPLVPCDVVVLDGYLCGVIVQPMLIATDDWLPPLFDLRPGGMPAGDDAPWVERVTALVLRRHAAINRALAEDGWFDPLVLEPGDEAGDEAGIEADTDATSDAGPELATAAALDADPTFEPSNAPPLHPITAALQPWVAGFELAAATFPALDELDDDAVMAALARLYRHLPAETDEQREVVTTLDRLQPLGSLDAAIEDMVGAVADLWDLTRAARYRVVTVRRDGDKVGRNDPCTCGGGKKFKHCHGR